MDFFKIKLKCIEFRKILLKHKITPDVIILFGSHAQGRANKNSDVDLAIVSRDFNKNKFKMGSKLNRLVYDVLPEAEVIPISLDEYLSTDSISPILYEIKKNGIAVL
jgi:predicted nucleotidyltransferase